jgi:hypothetical protein
VLYFIVIYLTVRFYIRTISILKSEYPLVSAAAADCVTSLSALLGPSIFMHKIPAGMRGRLDVLTTLYLLIDVMHV